MYSINNNYYLYMFGMTSLKNVDQNTINES